MHFRRYLHVNISLHYYYYYALRQYDVENYVNRVDHVLSFCNRDAWAGDFVVLCQATCYLRTFNDTFVEGLLLLGSRS